MEFKDHHKGWLKTQFSNVKVKNEVVHMQETLLLNLPGLEELI